MKKSIEVDRDLLIKIIHGLEKEHTYINQSLLWDAAAGEYNKRKRANLKAISPAVVRLRVVTEWKVDIKTKPGKKGRVGGVRGPRGPRVPRAKKFEGSSEVQESLRLLEKVVPAQYQHLVSKIRGGSRTAATKLKCLECSGWMSSEVGRCVVKDCPMWAFRPYKRGDESPEEEPEAEAAEVAI